MSWEMPPEVGDLLRCAEKEAMLPGVADGEPETQMDRAAIEGVLPHRDPFLFLDRVERLDLEQGTVAGEYDLARSQAVLSGHFPQRPIWPGVLQVEAIAQAGCLVALMRAQLPRPPDLALTQVLAARFMRPVLPGAPVQVAAQVIDDGLFFIVVGQCIQSEQICSAVALRGYF